MNTHGPVSISREDLYILYKLKNKPHGPATGKGNDIDACILRSVRVSEILFGVSCKAMSEVKLP